MSSLPENFDTDYASAVGTPPTAPLPIGAPRRLIDSGLTHYEASIAGVSERYGKGETPQTIHVWWARRPHSAMRALLFAAASLDCSKEALELMTTVGCRPVAPSEQLKRARKFLRPAGRRIKVLDMFGGGGTIPFEGSTLGFDMHSIDSNELSVFLQKSLLVHGCKDSRGLSAAVRAAGERVLERLHDQTARLYPSRNEGVTNYIWSYSTNCAECGYRFFLLKRPWLSRKKGRQIAVGLRKEPTRQGVEMIAAVDEYPDILAWEGRNGNVVCPACAKSQRASLTNSHDELIAVVKSTHPGKQFILAAQDNAPNATELRNIETQLLRDLGTTLPASELPRWTGIVNPALYGMRTHADVFNPRQRIVVLTLIKILKEEFSDLEKTKGTAHATSVVGLLSGLIDQCVDWNCRLSMWISQNEQVGRAFCGPGIAMLWDYAETDPTAMGPGNLRKKLDRIESGINALTNLEGPCSVQHAYAQSLPFRDGYFDAIVTDPPYYDNIYYNVLADFFFSWKRLLLEAIEPQLFKNSTTDSTRELVASTFRHGSASDAHEDYCRQLSLAVSEAARVLRPDGVFAFLYSHSSFLGWSALLRAYRNSALRITSVQPLSIERKARPRAMTSDAINTCIVFVARRDAGVRRPMTLEQICGEIDPVIQSLHESLDKAGWREADIGVAAFAHGVAILANADGLIGDVDDWEALRILEAGVRARCPNFRVTSRKSL